MKNKVFSSILAFAMTVSFVSAAGQTVLAADDGGDGLPSVTFTHGYYHDESEWAPAAEMRKIYQEFADMHKDEFTFNIGKLLIYLPHLRSEEHTSELQSH